MLASIAMKKKTQQVFKMYFNFSEAVEKQPTLLAIIGKLQDTVSSIHSNVEAFEDQYLSIDLVELCKPCHPACNGCLGSGE